MLPAICLSALVVVTAAAAEAETVAAKERLAWKAFAKSLNTEAFAKDYPGPLRDLDSADAEKCKIALDVLGASRAIEAIPFIVPFLDSRDRDVRVHAAMNLEHIVSGIELRRRDHAQEAKRPMKIVLRPRTAEEPDLRPLRWVVRRMLTAGEDYGTEGYAATMAAYIGLPELGNELKALLRSRHPAVTRSAASALRILGLEEDAGEEEQALEVMPWPGGKEPEGFMRGIKLVALPPALCEKIVRGAKQSEAPREKPNIKSPAEAAAYFNSHLNMVEPPKYMAVYKAASGETYYIFSGGMHWGRKPLFSQAAVLLESGAIRPYR